MKRFVSLLLVMCLVLVSASALAKGKATATPPPLEITTEVITPPPLIQHMLEIAHGEWENVDGKDQGEKNKYTTWYNNYNWGKNKWCAGYVTWCMLEAGVPLVTLDSKLKNVDPMPLCIKDLPEEAPVPVCHVRSSSPSNMVPGYEYMHRTTMIPQKGFVVLYSSPSIKFIHVGIVYDVEPLGDGRYRLTTLEGAMKNTVRKFVYDYDPNAELKNNISPVPDDQHEGENTKTFTYELRKTDGKKWFVRFFMMPWVPGEEEAAA